jgi:hypothetical protein
MQDGGGGAALKPLPRAATWLKLSSLINGLTGNEDVTYPYPKTDHCECGAIRPTEGV